MKQVKEMPESGQFAAVWTYNNRIWCGAFKFFDDKLFNYADIDGTPEVWHEDNIHTLPFTGGHAVDVVFFIDE